MKSNFPSKVNPNDCAVADKPKSNRRVLFQSLVRRDLGNATRKGLSYYSRSVPARESMLCNLTSGWKYTLDGCKNAAGCECSDELECWRDAVFALRCVALEARSGRRINYSRLTARVTSECAFHKTRWESPCSCPRFCP